MTPAAVRQAGWHSYRGRHELPNSLCCCDGLFAEKLFVGIDSDARLLPELRFEDAGFSFFVSAGGAAGETFSRASVSIQSPGR